MFLSLSDVTLIHKQALWTTRALNSENCYETEQARYLEDPKRVSSFEFQVSGFEFRVP